MRRDEEAAELERTEAGRATKGTFRENDEALAGSYGVGGRRGILDALFGVGALGEEGAKAAEEDGRNNVAVELLLGHENKMRLEYRDQDEGIEVTRMVGDEHGPARSLPLSYYGTLKERLPRPQPRADGEMT